jgi:pyruvate,orthophosphate dikinase
MTSKALQINLERSRVDVTISEKYKVLQEVMSKYHGILEELNGFLEELCHPFKNWRFIVRQARGLALDHFHLLRNHPKGPDAVRLYADIFLDAVTRSQERDVKSDAADHFLLYFQRVIQESKDDLPRFLNVLDYGFERIRGLEEADLFLFVRSFYPINRLAEELRRHGATLTTRSRINALLVKYLQTTYGYWLGREDPQTWFCRELGLEVTQLGGLAEIFDPISHRQLSENENRLRSLISDKRLRPEACLDGLLALPGYAQVVESYHGIPKKILSTQAQKGQGNHRKLIFLFLIMNTGGLASIHEETLRDINRTLTWLIEHEDIENLKQLLKKTFAILKTNAKKYPSTALTCVLNMGKAVYQTEESTLVDFFIDAVIDMGFQAPELQGVGEDGQIRANVSHVQNIRTWLELIEMNPRWSKRLLSTIIVHLALRGVFIKDTDLFPRDITKFLNSDVEPVYNLAKQLARLFPAFFNDIGAEGRLRDISTDIDEICLRKDVLIHFLRKQSHVESSSQIINLMEATLSFWRTREKHLLKPYVPPNVYLQIENRGAYIDGVHRIMTHLFEDERISKTCDLLKLNEEELEGRLDGLTGIDEVDIRRIKMAVGFYKMVYQKYSLTSVELGNYLKHLPPGTVPRLAELETALSEPDARAKIYKILTYLEYLRSLILSPLTYEVREDIYRKRHFTIDIPSMYGSYREAKFDALGLTLRLERLVNVLFEELVDGIDLNLITRATFSQILDYLGLFSRALSLDGISSMEMKIQLDLLAQSLKAWGFSFTQFLDIFRGLSQAVRNIVNDYFHSVHQQNLKRILEQIPAEAVLPKYRLQAGNLDRARLTHTAIEVFLREMISASLGLQQLDLFLTRILNTLFQQSDKLRRERLRVLLNYDPQRAVTPIAAGRGDSLDIISLGNKGLNLIKLMQFGFPVPPGFIITTEIFKIRSIVDDYPPAEKNLKEQVARELSALEARSGKAFGDPENPLLLSVRSGATISQPGMMDSFLNVGINEEIVRGIIRRTKHDWFAWDCYRRFLQAYGMVFGLPRDYFDEVIARHKTGLGVFYKRDFTGAQMKKVALTYKDLIRDHGIELMESPFEQLYVAISRVFDSWNSAKAKTFRKIMGISDDWGTAVTVQQMVFGNLSQESGSGVVFTHRPTWPGDTLRLWGDFTIGNQGEDVVSGLVKTIPISQEQAEEEKRRDDLTLENHFPEIYRTIRGLAERLIHAEGWGPQEIEFTFESPLKKDLYFLQTRDMAVREPKQGLSFLAPSEGGAELIGHAIGVSGGALTGRIVYNSEEIRHWREKEPETSLILLRSDTVPDDIKEIHETDGLLTARGGSTSHAAIIASRLGKTCLVGCADLVCVEKKSMGSLNNIQLRAGDWISIDGRKGSIYSGIMKVKGVE